MLVIMKKRADEAALDNVKHYLTSKNFDIHQSTGANRIIIGVIGNTGALDVQELGAMQGVLQVIKIAKEE